MKNYPEPAPGDDWRLNEEAARAALDLPADPEFLSRLPRVELQAMLHRIQENMPWRSTRPGEPERRLARKVDVEFVL